MCGLLQRRNMVVLDIRIAAGQPVPFQSYITELNPVARRLRLRPVDLLSIRASIRSQSTSITRCTKNLAWALPGLKILPGTTSLDVICMVLSHPWNMQHSITGMPDSPVCLQT